MPGPTPTRSGGFALPGVVACLLLNTAGADAQSASNTQTAGNTQTPVTAVPVAANATRPPGKAPEPASSVEQVTVTALKQKTNLQKAPAAITAVSSATLDKSNITNLAGLNGIVPGLTITKSAGFENLVNIRGVGSETPENALTTQPGVSLFIDGAYIANSISLDQTLFDLDHIEVLRGPQGTLYGQSSTGGVITLVTRQPVIGEYNGHADVGIGDYHLFRERAAVNVPVSSQVAVRLSIQKYDHDGFGRSVAIPGGYPLDDAHDISGKAAILWKPSENFSATFSAQWYRAVQDGAEQKNILDPDPDPRQVNQDYPSSFVLNASLYHLNLNWTLPFAALTSVTAYQDLTHRQSEDSSRLSYALLGSYDDIAAWNTGMQSYSQELTLSSLPGTRLAWTAGVFVMKQRSTQFVAEFEGKDANPDLTIPPDVETDPPSNLGYGNSTTVNRLTWSPYAQTTYHLTDKLRLTGGVRYNHDHYTDYDKNFANFGSSAASSSYTTGRVTGNIEADYDITPRSMVYSSLTEGYKPGGLNGNVNAQVVGLSFLPEGITSFEVGSKNTLFNDRLRLNVAGFFYDYRNMQYIETDPFPFAYGISNVPNTHIWGGEAEASYLVPGNRLRFNGQLTLEDGKMIGGYKAIDSVGTNAVYASNPACGFGGQYYNPACWTAVIAAARSVNGNKPPNMPTVQASVNAEYTIGVGPGKLLSRAEFVYRGPEYARVFNDAGLDHVPAYMIVNLDFQYKINHTNWSFALLCSNLTDKAGVNSRYTDPYGTGQTSEQYIPPRQVIGSVAYSF